MQRAIFFFVRFFNSLHSDRFASIKRGRLHFLFARVIQMSADIEMALTFNPFVLFSLQLLPTGRINGF